MSRVSHIKGNARQLTIWLIVEHVRWLKNTSFLLTWVGARCIWAKIIYKICIYFSSNRDECMWWYGTFCCDKYFRDFIVLYWRGKYFYFKGSFEIYTLIWQSGDMLLYLQKELSFLRFWYKNMFFLDFSPFHPKMEFISLLQDVMCCSKQFKEIQRKFETDNVIKVLMLVMYSLTNTSKKFCLLKSAKIKVWMFSWKCLIVPLP